MLLRQSYATIATSGHLTESQVETACIDSWSCFASGHTPKAIVVNLRSLHGQRLELAFYAIKSRHAGHFWGVFMQTEVAQLYAKVQM